MQVPNVLFLDKPEIIRFSLLNKANNNTQITMNLIDLCSSCLGKYAEICSIIQIIIKIMAMLLW